MSSGAQIPSPLSEQFDGGSIPKQTEKHFSAESKTQGPSQVSQRQGDCLERGGELKEFAFYPPK